GAVILKTNASDLDIVDGRVVKKGSEQGITLAELARICYYRGNELPVDFQPELVVTRHYRVKDYAFVFSNGAQGCSLEVDPDGGRNARHRVRACGNADEDLDARRQGRGRGGHRRRAGRDHERGERRAAPARVQGHEPADHAGSRAARAR